jgi:hypothetical protein
MGKSDRRRFIKTGIAAGSVFFLPSTSYGIPGFLEKTSNTLTLEDDLRQNKLLDVTREPYFADPTGRKDSTLAIQKAVDDARDNRMVCFFPGGTYLISDTISCEQRVQKLDRPRYTDTMRQSWWDTSRDRHFLLGSAKGDRPVLKLSHDAVGFDDPENPKYAMKIWAQTRNDLPGKHEPEWGSEQPNISFGHILKGIDFDIRGHAGAIGLRHAGSQGSRLMDSKVYAEGALAGFNDCPGQGGGTFNIEVEGGKFGLLADPTYRFPMLAACSFIGQTEAPIKYTTNNLPMVLAGCVLESKGDCAVDLSDINRFPGLSMIDCHITLKNEGSIVKTNGVQNVFMENCYVNGTHNIINEDKRIQARDKWMHIARFSSSGNQTENLINGKISNNLMEEMQVITQPPGTGEIRALHWRKLPSFEDKDAVNIKTLGAKGDGKSDDTKVFRKAVKKYKKIFLPNGTYKLNEPLQLGPDVQLFGINSPTIDAPSISTYDNPDDRTQFSFVNVSGALNWNSGKGDLVFCRAKIDFGLNGGGRLYSMTHIGGRETNRLLEGTRQPISFYTLNVERRPYNPQARIHDAKHVRIFYMKSESSPVGFGVHGGANSGNTPLGISDSEDIRVYALCGNILTVEQRPVIEIVNSNNVMVSQVKSFKTGDFPQLREIKGDETYEVSSDKIVGLFIRN